MKHVPVLLNEVIESLQLKPNANVIDCTLGDGGHSEAILEKTSPNGKLLGIDADSESLLRAKKYLYKYENRVIFVRDNFVNLKKIIDEKKFNKVNGILIDLGWSSPQFAERGRGFSFQTDEVLDMRYDPSSSLPSAKEILQNATEFELEKIFREYGEENNSRRIAKLIVERRKENKIERTQQLVVLVEEINGKHIGKIHPATRVFQALRIAVNDELGVVKKVLPDAIDALVSGGRLAVISFHSLEDRIVKHYFKDQDNKKIKIITNKPIICSEAEAEINLRARSAKLRVVEKL